ncbi:MAG: tetratricopeptide repeat protein [Flavobacteriales bacterium]|nr:tetratricopeptide repeat protein [Flavobacteriales bacterium]
MGESAGNLQDFDAAINYLNQALSIQPNDPNTLNFIGMAYAMTKKHLEAEKVFEKALALNTGRIDILMNLALCYFNQGKVDQEQVALGKILVIEPNNAMAKSRLRRD